jgi:LPXTG-motif cell wall-anchored protein
VTIRACTRSDGTEGEFYQETNVDSTTLLIIIILVLVLGGGFYGRGRWW